MAILQTATMLSIISIALLLDSSIAIDDPFLYHICSSNAGNYTYGSAYEDNVSKVLGLLQLEASSTGYRQAGSGTPETQAFGLALCRGDVKPSDCKACVANASIELTTKLCPHDKGAIVWYDYCMLKYSTDAFFGQIDDKNQFSLVNVESIGNKPKLFNQKVKYLLSQLAKKASKSSKLYGNGELKLDTFTNLYGLAQCTRDLTIKDCESCLVEAINELPTCCDGKQGGRVVGGSCNVRYEIYPFLNSR